MVQLNREVRFIPGYDHRNKTPNYGQHPMHIHFIVRGEEGALVLNINTGLYPDPTQRKISSPTLHDLTFHKEITNPLDFDEDTCYDCNYCSSIPGETSICKPSGYSYTVAEQMFDILICEGEKPFWNAMEAKYYEH